MDRISLRYTTLKSRGIASIMNGLVNINTQRPDLAALDADVYETLERITLAKMSDFTAHDLVTTFKSFYILKQGSGNLYERLV